MFKFNRKNIVRLLLFVGAIAVISYFIPRERDQDFNYAIGRPWTYSLLTAPYDIPVNLDSASAAKRRDSVDRAFIPIYRRDNAVASKAVADLGQALSQHQQASPSLQGRIQAAVRGLYADGIVDSETYSAISKGRMPGMRFIAGNVAQIAPTGKMKSARAAYAAIDSIFQEPYARIIISDVKLKDYLQPNVVRDSAESARLLEQAYLKALAPIGVKQKGERIVDRGDIVTPQIFEVLKEYERLQQIRGTTADNRDYRFAGQIVVVAMLLLCFYTFFYFFRRRTFDDMRRLLFLVAFVTVFTLVTYLVLVALPTVGVYVMPFTVLPIIITTFYDSRTAMFAHIVETLLCALVVAYPMEFIFCQFIAGLTAIMTLQELSRRSQLVKCAIYVLLAYILAYSALEVVNDGNVQNINWHVFLYFGLNVVFLSFAYIFIFLIEKAFGFISTVTLVELTDVNNPLLRELSEKCPGTFQHSLQVSNLAAEAAHVIGANVQLVRAGALYHDIGKIDNPAFFTENQRGENPHKALPPEVSAKIIIEHVTGGLKRADRAKLPQVIKDFIAQHHGAGKAKYFYTMACNAHPDEEIDPAPYTYPGPNPNTKETSILMMADSTEAASRSLTDHSDASISQLVNRIIDSQIADGLLKDSPISFRDVEKIKQCFISRLCTMYHSRIKYPEANKKS